MSTKTPSTEPVDINDPKLSRFEIIREGARRDDIEIVHYEPQFPPGSKAEKRMVRIVAMFFLITGIASIAFLGVFIFWPWEYEHGAYTLSKFYTPLLGVTLGIALLGIGFGILTWAKKLLPHEISVQDRHVGTDPESQKLTGETALYMLDELGLKRRPLLKGAIGLGLAPVAVVAAAPLIGGLIKDPHGDERQSMFKTGFNPVYNDGNLVRLVQQDGSPVRPEDVSAGGQITVFPGIAHGNTNEWADSPTLLIHLREDDARKAAAAADADDINRGAYYGNYVAFTKICSHAGCPASLYEQQTNRLLCPCHQSQFLIIDNARPVFGPAHKRLAMLPIEVDSEGFFVAKSDYKETVGPDFWERP
ncbi:ubiquinol-cytochrome c reductase iron-sulfur subunit [Catenuloplanes nepalensis]|uniref:Cytochrome bc1 complex Rieske iron-sulfur subunit n=1 Tax=Catenuloplanes nepalensis TaxID=587533 RepID=A0ABT9MKA5_9ACTN|nr:Rieske 2Fe-2S domain-containing protein [Catenuloplanes nepalensis]MDP9791857.1 ubiquinol-cytochrome c reductase iron-sulfur subunit [Catenuloplanes nepalensis]